VTLRYTYSWNEDGPKTCPTRGHRWLREKEPDERTGATG
jgi:hypothetical protein